MAIPLGAEPLRENRAAQSSPSLCTPANRRIAAAGAPSRTFSHGDPLESGRETTAPVMTMPH